MKIFLFIILLLSLVTISSLYISEEDTHIAYKEPFSIAILRSFAINLYQLFLNANKGKKKILPTGKVTMAEIKRNCHHRDDFTASLFEQKVAG